MLLRVNNIQTTPTTYRKKSNKVAFTSECMEGSRESRALDMANAIYFAKRKMRFFKIFPFLNPKPQRVDKDGTYYLADEIKFEYDSKKLEIFWKKLRKDFNRYWETEMARTIAARAKQV